MNTLKSLALLGICSITFALFSSCNSDYTPKRRGITGSISPNTNTRPSTSQVIPTHSNTRHMPTYCGILPFSRPGRKTPGGSTSIFPALTPRIYISYKDIGPQTAGDRISPNPKESQTDRRSVGPRPIINGSTTKGKFSPNPKESNTFDKLRDDAFKMTFKHTYKANSIDQTPIQTPNGIGGVFFNVGGNAATANQFFVTDTTRHFLRGALYFDTAPNEDSLGIVNKFLEEDMVHLINTFRWK